MQTFFSQFFFTLLVLVTVVPAVLCVLTLNIVRAACWLLLSLTGAAGLFFFLGADFVGGTQLLIYVGGTLVLVIFGVMLTATGPFAGLASKGGDWALAAIGGAALFTALAYGSYSLVNDKHSSFTKESELPPTQVTTNRIGMAFMGFGESKVGTSGKQSGYLLPFEVVSVHLVVVLIGAAYLARAKQRRAKED